MFSLVVAFLVFISVTAFSLIVLSRIQERKAMRLRVKQFVGEGNDEGEHSQERPKSSLKSVLARLSFSLGIRSSKKLELELQKADIPLKAGEFVVLNIISATLPLVIAFVGGRLVVALVLSLFGAVMPQLYIKSRQVKRAQKFSAQIPEALVMISNSLKAGYSFLQAMELVASEMAEPMSKEFARSLKEMNLGMTTEEALQAMVNRVASDDIDLVVTAVIIQRQIGGNLSEILDTIAFTIRERIRIKGELQTLTAQGRLSGLVIGALPIGLTAFIYAINPEYMSLLFTHPVGRVFVAIGVTGQLLAVFMIRKIINIKV